MKAEIRKTVCPKCQAVNWGTHYHCLRCLTPLYGGTPVPPSPQTPRRERREIARPTGSGSPKTEGRADISRCRNCGAPLGEGAAFCVQCGRASATPGEKEKQLKRNVFRSCNGPLKKGLALLHNLRRRRERSRIEKPHG